MKFIGNLFISLLLQIFIGFWVWVFWQITVPYLSLPSIPLFVGVCLWLLWFTMLYVPIFLATFIARNTKL